MRGDLSVGARTMKDRRQVLRILPLKLTGRGFSEMIIRRRKLNHDADSMEIIHELIAPTLAHQVL
jgi:hypothetical protein